MYLVSNSRSMFSTLSNILSSLTPTGNKDTGYTQKDEIWRGPVWSFHRGARKADGLTVTVLTCQLKDKDSAEVKAAQMGHLKLKTMKHPNVLKYLDGTETVDEIRIVTEEATPLEVAMKTDKNEFSIKYGILQLLRAIDFLSKNEIVHGNIGIGSVFVDSASEWKLGGLEYSHPASEPCPPKPPSLAKCDPPESSKSSSKRVPVYATDMWGLGVLIYEVYHGPLQHTADLRSTKKIPKDLIPHYCSLVSANPSSRPNPNELLQELRSHGSYLSDPMISIAVGAEELHVMESQQRKTFLESLNRHIEQFPKAFCRQKLLTALLNTFNFSNAGTLILEPLFKIAQYLEDDDYQSKIVPCVVKLFSSTDRAVRIQLLQKMSSYVEHIRTCTASNDIFPSVALGFTDTVQVVREETVKSMMLLAPKLSPNILNNQLLKYLAKCQMDQIPSIRTNTTVVIGKLATLLDQSTQQRVLSSAFLRGLKDPFVPAKMAALVGLCTTSSLYTPVDVANKIIPSMSPLLIDSSKEVREKGFNTIQVFLKVLEHHSATMADSVEQQEGVSSSSSGATWSWATSLTSVLYKGKGGEEKKTADEPSGRTLEEKTSESQSDHDNSSGHKPSCTAKEEPQQSVAMDNDGKDDDNDDEWISFENKPSTSGKKVIEEDQEGAEGWDDWATDDFDVSKSSDPVMSSRKTQHQEPLKLFTMHEDSEKKEKDLKVSTGWKNDDGWSDDWADSFSSAGKSAPQSSNQSRDLDSRQLKQEERRKKQEAARQKRAAGTATKPKLGGKGD